MLDEVVVTDARERTEPGLVRINPKNALVIPSPAGGVEALIKTLVGSNNELTSQYSVRGGNYDENLIYINDFEVYRTASNIPNAEMYMVFNSFITQKQKGSVGSLEVDWVRAYHY